LDVGQYTVDRLDGLIVERLKPSIWAVSPLESLRNQGTIARGKAGYRMAQMWAEDLGYRSAVSRDKIDIEGIVCQVRTAFESESNAFLINQIRPKQDFEYVIAMINRPPCTTYVFVVPKGIMVSLSKGQHGGAHAKETMMYRRSKFVKIWSELNQYCGLEHFRKIFGGGNGK
jgi:hypothetical protein